MAFRQPAHHPVRIHHSQPVEATSDLVSPQPSEEIDESQGWILFPTGTATNRTFTATTQCSLWTTGRSRISDNGSLHTAAHSYGIDEDGSEQIEAVVEDEEDGELDSLDSHLLEFRAEPSLIKESSAGDLNDISTSVLPTHDGLGSFRVGQTTMGAGVQEHLYTFEQYNPRRIKRRRESLELGQLALESERLIEHERIRRIEEWRLEQSRVLLDEIQKETRRRKYSSTSEQRSMGSDGQEEEAVTLGRVAEKGPQISIHQDHAPEVENEGFWSRITRRVIQDLMGIDDHLLSILFGEALPELSPTHSVKEAPDQSMVSTEVDPDTWEYRLLHRLARELGLLVNQISEHPDSFSTYARVQQMPLPYAGLPIIPEAVQEVPQDASLPTPTPSAVGFRPTIETATQLVDIPRGLSQSNFLDERIAEDLDATPRPGYPIHQATEAPASTTGFTREEWEKELDIRMVFRYLRSRFTSRPAVHNSFARDASYLATSTSQDAAARAARVRQHHPLTRSKSSEKRSFKVVVPGSPIQHRRGSSCASQSTKRSARRNSGSSRHYWDLNGSIGSGSLIASGGAWGEV